MKTDRRSLFALPFVGALMAALPAAAQAKSSLGVRLRPGEAVIPLSRGRGTVVKSLQTATAIDFKKTTFAGPVGEDGIVNHNLNCHTVLVQAFNAENHSDPFVKIIVIDENTIKIEGLAENHWDRNHFALITLTSGIEGYRVVVIAA